MAKVRPVVGPEATMSDVYRINPEVVEPEFTGRGIARLISDGVLVPVDPTLLDLVQ